MTLPPHYAEQMKSLLGEEESADYFAALEKSPERSLRLNRTKLYGDVPQIPDTEITPSGILPDAYFFSGAAGGRNPLHHAGAYYIQEISAMLPVASSPVREGWRVLDLCAAPGGKTGMLAELVGESGHVVANEYAAKRARVLLGNVERMGYRNCAVYNAAPDALCRSFAGYFDLVLVDAPCSGEGMFRKEPDALADWSPEASAGCAARQIQILKCAADAVKPGGYLLYSTCTFSPAEDEDVLIAFLRDDPRFTLIPPCVPDSVAGLVPGIPSEYGTERCFRAYPHKIRGEGQFFGLMRRDDSPVYIAQSGTAERAEVFRAERPRNARKADSRRGRADFEGSAGSGAIRSVIAAEKAAAEKFFAEFFEDTPKSMPLCAYKGDLFILSAADFAEIPTAGLLAPGVRLGSVAADGRLVPHHQFFSAFGRDAKIKVELPPEGDSAARIRRYLHGESVSAADCGLSVGSGWGVVTVCGCAVGGFRLSDGQMKNLYPKGLRD